MPPGSVRSAGRRSTRSRRGSKSISQKASLPDPMSGREPNSVLVTGATGYIGARWLTMRSGQMGTVTALVRPGAKVAGHLSVREGVIPAVDPESLLQGVDTVVHLA